MKRQFLETFFTPEPVKKKRPSLDTTLKNPLIPIDEFLSLDRRKKLPTKGFVPKGPARLNVFYPTSRRQIDGRLEKVEKDHSWGVFTYVGERLRVYDFETLIAINAIMMKRNTWNLNIRPEDVCKVLGTKPKKDQTEARRKSIFRLGSAVFHRYLPIGYRHSLLGTILILLAEDVKDGTFTLCVHPFFYRELINNNFTYIDIPLMRSLKGDTTKMAYVLYASQKKDHGLLLRTLLCSVCNLPDDTPNYTLTKKAKKVHDELVKKGFLLEYHIDNTDFVTPRRAPKKTPGRKSLSFFHDNKSQKPKEVKDSNPEITKWLIEFHTYLTIEKEYNDQEMGQFTQAAKKFKAAVERGDGKGIIPEVYDEDDELEPPYKEYIRTFFKGLRWKFKKSLDLGPGTWCSNKIWDSVWFPFLELNRPTEVDEDYHETHTHEEDAYIYKPVEDNSEENTDWDPTEDNPD